MKFLILAPHFNPASNGIMLIYRLGELLSKIGHQAYFYPLNLVDFQIHKHLYPEDILAKFIENKSDIPADAIAIMPDTTPPEMLSDLPTKNRIWYLMNKPWLLTGKPTAYNPEDAVLSYSGLISKTHHNVFFNRKFTDFDPESESHKLAIKNKKNLILVYYGKSRKIKISRNITKLVRNNKVHLVCIHRHFPSDREQLYKLLRSAKLLISFDPLTNLNYESTLCGTPCYIADNYMGINFDDYNIPLTGIFEDAALLETFYKDGIQPNIQKEIFDTYNSSTSNHVETAKSMVDYCQNWFSLVERSKNDPAIKSLLEQYNTIRLENDLLYFKTCKSTAIDPQLQTFTPSIGWKDWMFHTVERYRWYIYRDFVKYIRRLDATELATKLHYYKVERSLRVQTRVEKTLDSLKIN